jgi:uncharacterized protein (DUF2141 family)
LLKDSYLIMMRNLRLATIVATLALAATAFAQDTNNILRVHLDGFRSDNGKPHCTIYNDRDPSAFPSNSDKAVKESQSDSISNRTAEVDFSGLPAGKYAIVCFHDENNNGKFDENMLGMPKEGYCFSNNVKPRFSAPNFDQCAFDYKGGDQSISISMLY